MADFSRETVDSFLKYLFFQRLLAPKTIALYKTGFTRPVLLGWGFNVSNAIFSDLARAFGNFRPAIPSRPITWSLDQILGLTSEVEYCTVDNFDMMLSKCVFISFSYGQQN